MEEKRRPEQMTGSHIEGFSNDDSGKDEVSSVSLKRRPVTLFFPLCSHTDVAETKFCNFSKSSGLASSR